MVQVSMPSEKLLSRYGLLENINANIISRSHVLISRSHDIITRRNDILTRRNDIISHRVTY